ncbi:MAG: ATP-binding protein [Chloroflexaceae bacterium]|nr:ATP-binding protein [Chloroflexaceae bacterium]
MCEQISVDLPAATWYLALLELFIHALVQRAPNSAHEETTIDNIRLATHELCTNIIEHAYNGAEGRILMRLTLFMAPDRVVIETWDSAAPFDPTIVPLDPDIMGDRGRGLFLMRNLMDEVRYQARSNQSWVCNDGMQWQWVPPQGEQTPYNYWYMVKYL